MTLAFPKPKSYTHDVQTWPLNNAFFTVDYTEPRPDVLFGVNTIERADSPNYVDPDSPSAFGNNIIAGTARQDFKLLSASGTAQPGALGGWTYQLEARGNAFDFSQYHGCRGLRFDIVEYSDAPTGYGRKCESKGFVGAGIILPEGVSSTRGNDGVDIITIDMATPDAFLAEMEIPKQPYLLAGPALTEIAYWKQLNAEIANHIANGATETDIHFVPVTAPDGSTVKLAELLGRSVKGWGQGGLADGGTAPNPFNGFAQYIDDLLLTVGQAVAPREPNYSHFRDYLSPYQAFWEYCENHLFCNGQPIMQTFPWDMTDALAHDLERDVLHFELDGPFPGIVQNVSRHGLAKAWFDSRCQFHFQRDYSAMTIGEIPVAVVFTDGPCSLGELKINPAENQPRVSRAGVRANFLTGFGDNSSDPLSENFNRSLGAVYPPGASADRYGKPVSMTDYQGKSINEMAMRLYSFNSAKTTLSWAGFPFPSAAFGLLGRVVGINSVDPKRLWDYREGAISPIGIDVGRNFTSGYTYTSVGKLFQITNVSITNPEPDHPSGGYLVASLQGIEVIMRPT